MESKQKSLARSEITADIADLCEQIESMARKLGGIGSACRSSSGRWQ